MKIKRKEMRRIEMRLRRIESVCDAIFSEVLEIRRGSGRVTDIDGAIECLHQAARRMRDGAYAERDAVRGMYHDK